jgi:hypothetical protein
MHGTGRMNLTLSLRPHHNLRLGGRISGGESFPATNAWSHVMYHEVTGCRLCDGGELQTLIELGDQCLTGVFPRSRDEEITRGPLTLGRCPDCGLVQLLHSYEPAELYGDNYGYRSGLNRSMVEHLQSTVAGLQTFLTLKPGDLILDIGSNDGTTLSSYVADQFNLVGFDPSGEKFREYYRSDVRLIPEFFSADRFRGEFGDGARARLITSLAMFYDLEDPLGFMREIESILADDGLWHFEQSYLPAMLAANAYDTICHEHLEYYGVEQIKWMTDRAGLKIVAIGCNGTNGGSFAVTVSKRDGPMPENTAVIEQFLESERSRGLATRAPYDAFRDRVFRHRDALIDRLNQYKRDGRKVVGYGASTKGNVLLQFCGIDERLIPCIADVNERKFGCFTPGTKIPIVSEAEARALKPDCMLVLPWHFKANLLAREADYLAGGGAMLFPLPEILEVTR